MTSEPTTDWPKIVILFGAGIVGSMQFAKLSPIMVDVARDLALSPVMAGLSVSILGLVGVLFAITVGVIASVVGLAKSLRLAMFFGASVALLGAFAPEAYSFLSLRFLEGVSHLFIVVCAPALMGASASTIDRPIALAMWGCFFGTGYALTSLAAPFVVGHESWVRLLIAHSVVMFVMAGLVAFVTRHAQNATVSISVANIAKQHLDVFRSGAPLLLALTFFAYTVQFLAVLTFLHLYMSKIWLWPESKIGFALFMAPLWSLLFTLGAGWLVRGGVGIASGYAATFATLALSSAVVFLNSESAPFIYVAVAVMFACFGLLPGLTFANMTAVARTPQQVAIGFSAIALFGNLGTFLGTPLLARMEAQGGWSAVVVTLIVLSLLGIIFALALDRAVRKT
jgi:predicted MFS family arabinose efflux permease